MLVLKPGGEKSDIKKEQNVSIAHATAMSGIVVFIKAISPWARGGYRAPPPGPSKTGTKMFLRMSIFIFEMLTRNKHWRNLGFRQLFETG